MTDNKTERTENEIEEIIDKMTIAIDDMTSDFGYTMDTIDNMIRDFRYTLNLFKSVNELLKKSPADIDAVNKILDTLL